MLCAQAKQFTLSASLHLEYIWVQVTERLEGKHVMD